MNNQKRKLEKVYELLELLNDYHNFLNVFDDNTYDKLSELARKLESELDFEIGYLKKELEKVA